MGLFKFENTCTASWDCIELTSGLVTLILVYLSSKQIKTVINHNGNCCIYNSCVGFTQYREFLTLPSVRINAHFSLSLIMVIITFSSNAMIDITFSLNVMTDITFSLNVMTDITFSWNVMSDIPISLNAIADITFSLNLMTDIIPSV